MATLSVQQTENGAVRFAVHLQPRASVTAVVGLHGDALKIRLQAPPVDGAANAALIDLLARLLGVRRDAIRIVSGQTARRKVVEVLGVGPDRVTRLVDAVEGARK